MNGGLIVERNWRTLQWKNSRFVSTEILNEVLFDFLYIDSIERVFSAIRKGARAQEYENALKWLEDTGLIHLANEVETAKHPLKHYANTGCFKVYALNVGLLGAMAKSPVELLAQGKRLFNEYEGAFVENYVAQQLVSHFHQQLYYWRSKGGKAELDFLFEFQGNICPLEVKAGINPKSKSLKSYDLQYKPDRLMRRTLLNFKKKRKNP